MQSWVPPLHWNKNKNPNRESWTKQMLLFAAFEKLGWNYCWHASLWECHWFHIWSQNPGKYNSLLMQWGSHEKLHNKLLRQTRTRVSGKYCLKYKPRTKLNLKSSNRGLRVWSILAGCAHLDRDLGCCSWDLLEPLSSLRLTALSAPITTGSTVAFTFGISQASCAASSSCCYRWDCLSQLTSSSVCRPLQCGVG